MKKLSLTVLAAANLLLLPACTVNGGDDDDSTGVNPSATPPFTSTDTPTTADVPTDPGDTGTEPGDTGTEPGDTGTDTGTTDPTGTADGPICAHLGGSTGIGDLVTIFLGNVLVDERINAYFLSSAIDFVALGQCVTDQLGEATGCDGVTYTCRTMLASHGGLGISQQDFNDFAEDFVAAWDTHKELHPDVTTEDFDTVLGVLASLAPDIVEDATDNNTVYQRVGRKPAIKGLIGYPDAPGSFVANVAADAEINGFFGMTNFDRLNTCLTRQVHSLDGPNTYGKEIDPVAADIDPGVATANPCRDMVSSHADLKDDMDMGIAVADFAALVGDLITAMDDAGVPGDDQNIILGALGPLCPDIVTVDPEMCP